MVEPRHIVLGGKTFLIDEAAEQPFRRAQESRMVPRRELTGVPGAENLNTTEWLWAMADFTGGEGRQVFDPQEAGAIPPTFRKTDGGIDTRTPGQFSMSPTTRLRIDPDSGTVTTRTDGGDLTKVTGNETTGASFSHMILDAGQEGGQQDQTPPAGEVTVVTKFQGAEFTGQGGATVELNIREDPGGANTLVASDSARLRRVVTGAVLSATFTAAAATTYRYISRVSPVDLIKFDKVRLMYQDETTGSGTLVDPLVVQHGYAGKVWAANWDGTNSDVYTWDFTNNEWTLEHSNMVASKVVALANSDRFQYGIFRNKTIRQWTDGVTDNAYTADPATGDALGIAVAQGKLYALFTQAFYEINLDETAGLPLSVGTSFVKKAGNEIFPRPETADQDLRQQIIAMDGGVRWFINLRGEASKVFEFSDGAVKEIATLPRGYKATAIYHYDGLTFIGVQLNLTAADPAQKRAAIYYLDPSLGNRPRFLAFLRFENPDDAIISFMAAYGHDIYILQGNFVWRYDGRTGGVTLDRFIGSTDDVTALSLAVEDTKLWAAYEGVGIHVAEDTFPIDEAVVIDSPVWDFGVPHHDKVLLGSEIVTKPLPANTEIEFLYQLDEDGTWISAGTSSTEGDTTHRFTISDEVNTRTSRNLQWRVQLTSSDGVSSPEVRSIALRAYVLEYEPYIEFTVKLEDEDSENRTRSHQFSGRKQAEDLWTLVDAGAITTLVDHYSSATPGDSDSYVGIIEDPFQDLTEHGNGSARLRFKILSAS